jgi:hypothetical protein
MCLLDRRSDTCCSRPCLGGKGLKSGQGVALQLVSHRKNLDRSVASHLEEGNLRVNLGRRTTAELRPSPVPHGRHAPLESISGDICGSASPIGPDGDLLLGRQHPSRAVEHLRSLRDGDLS